MEKNEQRNLRMFGYYSGRVMESVKSMGMWANLARGRIDRHIYEPTVFGVDVEPVRDIVRVMREKLDGIEADLKRIEGLQSELSEEVNV